MSRASLPTTTGGTNLNQTSANFQRNAGQILLSNTRLSAGGPRADSCEHTVNNTL